MTEFFWPVVQDYAFQDTWIDGHDGWTLAVDEGAGAGFGEEF